jgi:hypothetical protein
MKSKSNKNRKSKIEIETKKPLTFETMKQVSLEGIKEMAKKPSFAVLLPTTAYILRLEPPPARTFIENNGFSLPFASN